MRKQPLFALGLCAAALLGQVSSTLANQAQTSGPQSAAQQSQPTGKQPSSQKAQGPRQSSQTGRQASGQNVQAAPPSPQTVKSSSLKAQAPRPPVIPPGYRLLTLNEGRAIARGIDWADDEEGLSPDCSHLVHKLYEQAGYPYPYASSTDLYRGTGQFFRARYAHPGDLVVWRGHVGIIVNPREHSFFSTTSSGTRIENYRSAYWRARGYPRFFRYLTKSPLKGSSGATEAANRPPQH